MLTSKIVSISEPESVGHQKKSAATRKAKDPDAFRKMGRKGAVARHNKSPVEESDIARRAAAKRKERDPDTFRKMGRDGGRAPHVSRGRYRVENRSASATAMTSISHTLPDLVTE